MRRQNPWEMVGVVALVGSGNPLVLLSQLALEIILYLSVHFLSRKTFTCSPIVLPPFSSRIERYEGLNDPPDCSRFLLSYDLRLLRYSSSRPVLSHSLYGLLIRRNYYILFYCASKSIAALFLTLAGQNRINPFIYKQLAPMEQQPEIDPEELEEIDIVLQEEAFDELESDPEESEAPKRRRNHKRTTDKLEELEEEGEASSEQSCDIYDDNFIIDRLPADKAKLQQMLGQVRGKIKECKLQFLKESSQVGARSYVGENAVPICADITRFDFQQLIAKQLEVAQREFDVLMMDPPWRLSSSQPSRGVAIQYSSLGDQAIENIPVPLLQREGFLFIWVINAKFQWTVNVMEKKWGYKVVDSINWVKKTVNGKIAKGHGFYLQHAKETCLVGYKGNFQNYNKGVASDVIFSERRGQSQKPTEIYEFIEKLVPNGYYLEIFGRRNNLRTNWVTIGNEL